MSSRPRPILKPPSSPGPMLPQQHSRACHVHFPTQPVARTYSAHSCTEYDRSAIIVGPNACALPARGCPGRTYDLSSDEVNRAAALGAYSSGSPTRYQSTSKPKFAEHHPSYGATYIPPPLHLDPSSSESDESSDGSTSERILSIPVLHYNSTAPIPLSHGIPYQPPPIPNAPYGHFSSSSSVYPPAPIQDPSFLPHPLEQKKKKASSRKCITSPTRPSFSPWSSEPGCLGGF